MQVQPYLFFDGRCEEAVEFYRRALDAELQMLMRYRESPEAPPPGMVAPGSENKVMHASFSIGGSVLMASDDCSVGAKPTFGGFALSISVADAAEAKRRFDALAEDGTVTMPLGRTFWSPCFGMLTDRFGVGWMINALAQ